MARSLTVFVAAGAAVSCAAAASAAPWHPANPRPTRPVATTHHTPPGNPTDGPGWSDNFDSYANGSEIIGQGGWEGWFGDPLVPQGYVSNAHASSAPNSLRLDLGDNTTTQSTDVVHQYDITGGQWVYTIKTFLPSGTTGADQPYFILLRNYQSAMGGTNVWSVQLHLNPMTGLVTEDPWVHGNIGTFTDVPVVLDQWVDVRVEINLDVQDGLVNIFYNDQPVAMDASWLDLPGTEAPPYTIKAVDLYNAGVSEFFYDDASLQPATVGSQCYANCDGSSGTPFLNVNDFICFQSKFAAGDSYANCDGSTGIPMLNVNDFICFQGQFAAGCSAP
jgi:hypothetical protein